MRVYLNGEIVESQRAMVSAFNPSFLQGIGLFETLRAYAGRPFRLEQHVERMRNSAARLHLPIEPVLDLIPEAARAVLDANQLADARIRITVTPADAAALMDSEPSKESPLVLVTAQPLAAYGPDLYEKGMTVLLCTDYRQFPQDPLAGHKTTSYFSRLIAFRTARERGCQESLWFNPANELAEGCISNVFIVRDARLYTPPLETPVLPGVTRATVIQLARASGYEVHETPMTVNHLLDAHEVFLTNTLMQVMPVTRVERKPVQDEKPGPLTRALLEKYRQLTAAE